MQTLNNLTSTLNKPCNNIEQLNGHIETHDKKYLKTTQKIKQLVLLVLG